MMIAREHMFDKVVTPSDVGEAESRLVVPKHFAERATPSCGCSAGGGRRGGLPSGAVLRFEDGRGGGKAWAFRFLLTGAAARATLITKGWSSSSATAARCRRRTVSFCRAGARLSSSICRKRARQPGSPCRRL
ncbi:hypothetical protein ZWY2020_028765 [Hordeum vulgare]|nr:hypothetical protein ZWY2020_028765 [Hordeum vulgare]